VDWLQSIGYVISALVRFMQSANIYHGVTLWDAFLSISALSIGVGLFKQLYVTQQNNGGGKS